MFQCCVVWPFLSIYSQMATSVVEAIIQRHSEDSSSHLGWNGSNLVGYCFLKSFKIWGRIWNTLDLRYPHRKKSQGVKSGERGCHSISPCKETTYPENMPLMISNGFLLCVYRQYRPLLAEESSVTLHNNDHCLLLLSHHLLKNIAT